MVSNSSEDFSYSFDLKKGIRSSSSIRIESGKKHLYDSSFAEKIVLARVALEASLKHRLEKF